MYKVWIRTNRNAGLFTNPNIRNRNKFEHFNLVGDDVMTNTRYDFYIDEIDNDKPYRPKTYSQSEGDGTVPIWSADLCSYNTDAPRETYSFVVSHGNLPKDDNVLKFVLDILKGNPISRNQACHSSSKSVASHTKLTNATNALSSTMPIRPSGFYVQQYLISGTRDVTITRTDDPSQYIRPLPGGTALFTNTMYNAQYELEIGDGVTFVLPQNVTYDIEFTTDQDTDIYLETRTYTQSTLIYRSIFNQVPLAIGEVGELSAGPEHFGPIFIDSDGDNVANRLMRSDGAGVDDEARDFIAPFPSVVINGEVYTTTRRYTQPISVEIASGEGDTIIQYALDNGGQYQPYTQTFTLDPQQSPFLSIITMDQNGNRRIRSLGIADISLAQGTVRGTPIGYTDTPYPFSMNIEPRTATLPLNYTWQATDHEPASYTGMLDSILSYTWKTPGTKLITVTVSNGYGDPVTATHTTIIDTKLQVIATASITGTDEGKINKTYLFTAEVEPAEATMPVTYTWQATDRDITSHTGLLSDTIQYTWDTSGTKYITVTTMNASRIAVNSNHTIVIAEEEEPDDNEDIVPLANLGLTGPSTGFVATSLSFTADAGSADATVPVTYTWQATDLGTTSHTGPLSDTIQYTWKTPGTKLITVTASNGYGDPVTATHKTMIDTKLQAIGTASITGIDEGKINETYPFTAEVEPADATVPVTYTWQATDLGTTSHTGPLSDTIQYTWKTSGTKLITVTASNVGGIVVSGNHTIVIAGEEDPDDNEDIVPLASLGLTGPSTGAVATSLSFTADAGPVDATASVTYTWQATNQKTASNKTSKLSDTVSYTWAMSGTKHITVTASNGYGEPVTTTHSVSIIRTQDDPYSRLYLPLIHR